MTTQKRLDYLARKLQIGAVVCLGLFFAWVFFAQPGLLGTAQASGPANPYEAENTRLQADFNLLKRENERLLKELYEAKKDKAAAAPTDTRGPSAPQPASAQADAVDETSKAIRANTFILKDENDKVRAVLSMEAGGRRLGLFNAAGKELAFLEVTEKTGPVLTFSDAAGRPVWSTADPTASAETAVPPKVVPPAPAPSEPQQCPTCKGTGVLGQCPYCEGTGKMLWPQFQFGEPKSTAQRVMPNARECYRCGGTGMKPCFRCDGKGVNPKPLATESEPPRPTPARPRR